MSDRSRLRLWILSVLVLSLLATLLGRLWYLQVLATDNYQRLADDNQLRQVVTPAVRGQILDDRGRSLITNKTALVVSVDRVKLLEQSDGGTAVLHRLAGVLHMPYDELHGRIQLCGTPHAPKPPTCWNGSPYQPIPVSETSADDAATRTAMEILERNEDFPGVSAEVRAVRSYPQGDLGAHLLGYIGPISDSELKKLPAAQQALHRSDLVGRSGLEESYNDALAGRPGVKTVSVDHLGAVTGTVKEQAPVAGDTLVTSIDSTVQAALEKSLADAVAHANQIGRSNGGGPADTAAGVVLDAQTGHVVALASYPTYDPQKFIGGISQADYAAYTSAANGSPLYDKATQGEYAPGSTFKLISTAGLVNEGTASLNGIYDCSPSVTIRGQVFHNFESESAGPITLHHTLVMSCDTVYYQLAFNDWLHDEALIQAGKKPREGVQHMAREFGLGAVSGIDLPSESAGMIEDRATKKKLWEDFYKPNACKGMNNPSFSPERRALDADTCKYGYILRPGDQVLFDIGQGTVAVTPLQMAVAYAALANGGTVYSPRIGKALIDPSGKVVKRIDAPVRDHVDVSPQVLDYIRTAMYGVTTEQAGTATGAFQGFPMGVVQVGGKTGTAEAAVNEPATAWFASFAGQPGHPRYVTVITVHHGGQGGVTAAPAVRQVWDALYGLEGKPAALPGGAPPAHLPTIAPDGTVEQVPVAAIGPAGAGAGGSAVSAMGPADVPSRSADPRVRRP